MKTNSVYKNRKAFHEYLFDGKYDAGVALVGTEVKSIRKNGVSFTDSYCTFIGDELFVRSMHIAEYERGSYGQHEPKRDRKLLLNKSELRKLKIAVAERGKTIIPTAVYFSDSGYVKMEIRVGRGKKAYDKRESLKAKDAERDMSKTNSRFSV